MALALTGAAALQGPLERQRDQAQLLISVADGRQEKTPGLMMLQLAPGGLRATLIAGLSIHAQALKQDGKFFDAKQQRELICYLQPYSPGTWMYHAWDMAWNISVETFTPQERWMWVHNGITLLRDKGLFYNPRSLLLYKELSWIFFAKMGQYTDEMHWSYKAYWAAQMHQVVGAPPLSGQAQDAIDAFRIIAAAPTDERALRADAATAAFLDRMEELSLKPDMVFLAAYNTYSDDPLTRAAGWQAPEPTNDRDRKLRDLVRDPKLQTARAAVLAYARRRVLVRQYRMDPDWMLQCMEKFGPMDWRHVNSHSLYWATYGLHAAQGLDLKAATVQLSTEFAQWVKDPGFQTLNTGRVYLGALGSLCNTGQVFYMTDPRRPDEPTLDLQPDHRFIEATHQAYLAIETALDGVENLGNRNNDFRDGHINWLSSMIRVLYIGRQDLAQHYYDEMRDKLKPDGEIFKLPLDEYVKQRFIELGTPENEVARNLVNQAFRSAYRSLAAGNTADFTMYRLFAAKTYKQFSTDTGAIGRNMLRQSFDDMEASVVATMLVQPARLGLNMSIVPRIQLYQNLPVPLQIKVYGMAGQALALVCRDEKIDMQAAFPAPPGMAPVKLNPPPAP